MIPHITLALIIAALVALIITDTRKLWGGKEIDELDDFLV